MPTDLRMNSFYYKIYCVFINSALASFLPLAALLYLNISTVKALKNMSFSRPFIPSQSLGQKKSFQLETRKIIEEQKVILHEDPPYLMKIQDEATLQKHKR